MHILIIMSYCFTKAVIQHVKIRSVSSIGDFRPVRGRQPVQSTPFQSTEEGVTPEVGRAVRAQSLTPLTKQP